jgi:hypothetical protein
MLLNNGMDRRRKAREGVVLTRPESWPGARRSSLCPPLPARLPGQRLDLIGEGAPAGVVIGGDDDPRSLPAPPRTTGHCPLPGKAGEATVLDLVAAGPS